MNTENQKNLFDLNCFKCVYIFIKTAPVPLSIEIEIQLNFVIIFFRTYSTDHKEISHMSRQ